MKPLRIPMICALILAMTLFWGCSEEGPMTPNADADLAGADQQRAEDAGVLKSGNNTVPFHMKVRNTIEVVPPFPPPTINAIFGGVGKSNPFGPFELHSTSQIDVTVYPFNQVTNYVFTYRNGDELHANSAGIATEDPDGTVVFSGSITFTGGTGMFSNATGSGTYAGTANTAVGEGQFEIDGDISGFGGPGF